LKKVRATPRFCRKILTRGGAQKRPLFPVSGAIFRRRAPKIALLFPRNSLSLRLPHTVFTFVYTKTPKKSRTGGGARCIHSLKFLRDGDRETAQAFFSVHMLKMALDKS
jgi:hypothetical protein